MRDACVLGADGPPSLSLVNLKLFLPQHAPASAAAMDSEEAEECPLCVEVLTVEDLKFEPCPCGYQVRAGGGG